MIGPVCYTPGVFLRIHSSILLKYLTLMVMVMVVVVVMMMMMITMTTTLCHRHLLHFTFTNNTLEYNKSLNTLLSN